MNSKTTLISQLDRGITATQREIEQAQQYLGVLQAAKDAVSKSAPTVKRRSRAPSGESRTAVITDILAKSKEPVSVSDIVSEMATRGRVDQKKYVHSTLSYLARKGVAKTSERGRWISITQEVDVAKAA